jgi:hypothetical protein
MKLMVTNLDSTIKQQGATIQFLMTRIHQLESLCLELSRRLDSLPVPVPTTTTTTVDHNPSPAYEPNHDNDTIGGE